MDNEKLRQQLEQIKVFITQAEGYVVLQEEIIADQIARDFDTTLARKLLASFTSALNRLQAHRTLILELLARDGSF